MLHITLKYNFADILTKHWDYQGTYYELIQPVFQHEGNTAALFLDDTLKVDASINEEEGMRFSILVSENFVSVTEWNAGVWTDCNDVRLREYFLSKK